MSTIRVQLDFCVPGVPVRLISAGALLLLLAGELGSENVTLTTYYPAPSGVYSQMVVTSNAYLARDTAVAGAGNGRVGIGTTNLGSLLSITGNYKNTNGASVTIGNAYDGDAAPNNGLIVQGLTGIGTSAPKNQLDINGAAAVGAYAGASVGPAGGLIVSGNVGIGTSAPLNNLVVNGQIVAGGVVAAPGSEPFSAEGPGSGISMADRAGGANPRWVVYPSAGALNVWNANDAVGVVFGQKGYIYINNANTACGGVNVNMDDVPAWKPICNGTQFATWTQGFYIEGFSAQNLGAPNLPPYGTGTMKGTAEYFCCAR